MINFLSSFNNFLDSVYCVALKENGNQITIATGGGDEIGTLYTAEKETYQNVEESIIIEKPQIELKGHTDSVVCTAWNFDRSTLATAGMDGMIQLWSEEGKLQIQLQGPADTIDVSGSNSLDIFLNIFAFFFFFFVVD